MAKAALYLQDAHDLRTGLDYERYAEEKGARAHIDILAKKYLGQDSYTGSTDETRVIYRIKPRHTFTMG